MQTILFQGDSITDVGRSRDDDEQRGLGYPHLLAARLGFEQPSAYRFVNRGISGNRVVDLYARIKCDFINLQPAVCSILIGVNDVWHELGGRNGVAADKFEHVYAMLLEEILTECPQTKFLLLEPFVLQGSATAAHWEYFRTEVKLRGEATERVAAVFGQTFVPLQSVFDEAVQNAPASYWLFDGVHPTACGHELLAREWLRAFQGI